MFQDFFPVVLVAEPLGLTHSQQLPDEVLAFVRVVDFVPLSAWQPELSGENIELFLALILTAERHYSDEQSVEDDAERPPVDSFVVIRVLDKLRGTIVDIQFTWCELIADALDKDFQVAVLIHHNAVQIKSTVSDALIMQITDCVSKLEGVELNFLLI